MCDQKGWKYNGFLFVWCEFVDWGGVGVFFGGCDDFLEMVKGYYGIIFVKVSDELFNIVKENF